jgi:glutamate racemase
MPSPIGIFDSGYGGLTVMKEIVKILPQYDYIYLGDNARSPYGPRSFETVYKYTLQAVEWLFSRNCQLVILACNTSSAKALRTIQQKDLPAMSPEKRVLGVIRPLTECVGNYTKSRHIGILGTIGTVASHSYPIEIKKFFPDIIVTQEACPMWVPLVENGEYNSDGADYFIKKHLNNIFKADPEIDAIVLGCTHYPLLLDKIRNFLPSQVNIISQGEIVSHSLVGYLKRHSELESTINKDSNLQFYTTDLTEIFDSHASVFFGRKVDSEKIKY